MASEVARLVGKVDRHYTGADGRPKTFQALHFMHLENTVSDVIGCKVEVVKYIPRRVDFNALKIGAVYQMVYEIREYKGEKKAYLSDLLPVEG